VYLNRMDTNYKNPLGATSSGIHLGHTLKFNRFSFTYQIGTYTHVKDKSDGTVYNVFAFRYRFAKHWFANLSMKTHLGKADFIGVGLGLVLFKKNKSQHSKNDVKGTDLY